MEELQARHRKEVKDLQAKITSKKKQATKKTRKGVNDECTRLEQDLQARHAGELAALDGEGTEDAAVEEHTDADIISSATAALSLDRPDPSATALPEPPSQPPLHFRRPNRARARMDRRRAEQEALMSAAASEAASLPDLKTTERDSMVSQFRTRGLVEKEIRADGHCLYSAFADQMDSAGLPLGGNGSNKADERYKFVRREAGNYMLEHSDEFDPFLEEDLEAYVRKVQETGEWGGQLELMALARRYKVKINVLQGDGRVEGIGEGEKELWMAYYRHGFGLGEHYNSLRKVDH